MDDNAFQRMELSAFFGFELSTFAGCISPTTFIIRDKLLVHFLENEAPANFISQLRLIIKRLEQLLDQTLKVYYEQGDNQEKFEAVYKQQYSIFIEISKEAIRLIHKTIQSNEFLQTQVILDDIALLERIQESTKVLRTRYLLTDTLTKRFGVSLDYLDDWDRITQPNLATLEQLLKTAWSVKNLAEFETVLTDFSDK